MDKDAARKLIAVTVFYSKKNDELTVQDFINSISFKKNLLPPDVVRKFVDEALSEGLLIMKNQKLFPNFSTSGIIVPLDFTVDEKDLFAASKDKPIIDRILDAATASGKMTKKEAIAKSHKLMEASKLMNFQTALLAIMLDSGIDISEFLKEIEEKKIYV
ncbi:MAG: DUF2240 family protein [Thermoplasmata archaeon]